MRIELEQAEFRALAKQAAHEAPEEQEEPEPAPHEDLLPVDLRDDEEEEVPSGFRTARAAHQVDNELLVARDMAARGEGLSGYSTVMVRHIPGKYTQQKLMREINARGFLGKYDFFYLLMQPQSRGNRGFAFINFNAAEDAAAFYQEFHGQRLRHFYPEQPLVVMPADHQGFEANAQHYAALRSTKGRRSLQGGRALFFRPLPEHLASILGGAAGADEDPGMATDFAESDAQLAAPKAPVVAEQSRGLHRVQRFCAYCGKQKSPDHAFCVYCGARAPGS